MPRYDLHCHSTWSDGLCTPGAVVERAAGRGVDVLALTDHDELGGLPEARAAADERGITLINGVEALRQLGNAHDPRRRAAGRSRRTAAGRRSRDRAPGPQRARAGEWPMSLAAVGIRGAYEGALQYVTSERLISRTHFARFLVETGRAAEVKDVFKRYLTRGKPGYVPHQWARLPDALAWIRAAGGQAVVAHPGRYPLSPTAMRRLLGEFRDLGGDAIEVLSASHNAAQADQFATYARTLRLRRIVRVRLARSRRELARPGRPARAARDLEPVWQRW